LVALKGPLGNVPAFRKGLQALLRDTEARRQLAEEIGIEVNDEPKRLGERS
jgi:type VI secretion system protein ImpB